MDMMVAQFRGVGIFELVGVLTRKGEIFMPYRYPPEFRRRILGSAGCRQVGGVTVG